MRKQRPVIILLGPPGAGKGTQAACLSSLLNVPAISTGEMLRRNAQSGSELGKLVSRVMASGELVSDELINEVLAERLRASDCGSGCILDGYPRSMAQARFLDSLMKQLDMEEPVVFNFDLPVDKVIRRLSRRRQCPKCGGIFSVNRNAEFMRCHKDGSLLVQRGDDKPEAIRQRLEVYDATHSALAAYYRTRHYYEIAAHRTPQQVSQELLSILDGRLTPARAVTRPLTAAPIPA